jgi:MFS family permease
MQFMSSAGSVRLGIDVGAGRVKAVLAWPNGIGQPVLFDGTPWLDAGVFVEPDGTVRVGADARDRAVQHPGGFVPYPSRCWTADVVEVDGRPVEVAELVAAPLRMVAEQAARLAGGSPGEVTVAVPAGWGPQRRTKLRLALYRAGLGQPSLVEVPVAVGWHLEAGGAALPVGSALLVCDFGVGFEATVIRRSPAGFEVLSTVDDGEAAGAGIDVSLAKYLSSDDATGPLAWSTVAEARLVKEGLSRASSVLARPAGQTSAVLVNVSVLREVAGPVVAGAVATARRAVEAAQVPAQALVWLVCVGGGARMPVVADPLAAEFGVRPVMAAEPDLAAVYGAVQAAPPVEDGGGRRVRLRRDPAAAETRAMVASVAAPLLASMGLFGQFLDGADRYGPIRSIEPGMLLAHWGGLAVASVMALLAAVAAAPIVTAARHEHAPNVRLGQRLLGAALAFGAVAGVVIAALYATIAAGYFHLPVGPFLRWSALVVLPVSAMVIVMAAVVVWRPDPPDGSWLVWLRFPLPTVLLVGFGTFLVGFDVSGAPQVLQLLAWGLEHLQPAPPDSVISLTGRIGAAAVGAGVALLLVRRTLHRVFVAIPLAAILAGTLTSNVTGMIAAGVIAAVAGWWLWRALYVLLRPIFFGDNGPPTDSTPPPPPSPPPPTGDQRPDDPATIDGVVIGETRPAEPH